ncbi:dTDP-glucose 4,6-dehydratase [Virgibacillus sp. SK37]|uniref:dTDP-glucose 4,6-dehydratase n=1 Tax=Virgibacillus sp. SK37 TaxID=403957 RepID=UPI0004D0BC00|nr:dTDP-glucose 4,6-dehydratase [Virgibacillus sp. SK37]AIF44254.1 dTDP-glucose 4,6-dehydratase [Virgibacillus sp. SK37]
MIKHNKTLLVTGGAGFIGSNFVAYMIDKYPDYQIINIDKLTYAGNLENVSGLENHPNYEFIQGDIADQELIESIFTMYDVWGVVHFAAESHVDRSIEDAAAFIHTNILGTQVLLQTAKMDWERKGELSQRRFHHISTDEVYGSLGEDGMFSENTPYDPRNPYSASKAGANLLVKSFGYTYGMNIVITSSSNNYGPRQHEEKLIPTIIFNALAGNPIPIYGDGKNIRDWLYVMDHCKAIDLIFHQAEAGEIFNIGGRSEKMNIEVVKTICGILDEMESGRLAEINKNSFTELISFTKDRLGHDRRYAVDDSKLRQKLGWRAEEELKNGLIKTVEWYVKRWKSLAESH